MRALFTALFLLLPLSILVASSTPVPVTKTSPLTYQRTMTTTYTSTVFDTTVVSTSGYEMVQKPVNISPQGVGFMAPEGKCSQDTIPLTIKAGTTLSLELTSTNPANLYLLPTYTYQTSPNGCDLIGTSILAANNFTDYKLHWTATEDSTLYLLLTGPNTIIIMRDAGSSESVQQFATATYTRTETSLNLQSTVNIANYTTTTVTADSSTLLPQVPFGFSFVTFTLSLLASALLLGPWKRFLNQTVSSGRASRKRS